MTSYSQAPPGFWQMNGYFSRLPSGPGAGDLGQVVLDAFEASNRLPPNDVDVSNRSFAAVLEELGLRDYAQYMKGAASVSLEIGDDDVLKITPMENGGARMGFVEITDRARVLDDRSAPSLVNAIEHALTHADG